MKDKYSVIIPTIWHQDLTNFLDIMKELDAHADVEEIILIDNKKDFQSPEKQEILDTIGKLVYLPMDENIYVNPAWNLGAKTAKADYIIILNDDVWTNPSIGKLIETHKNHFDKVDSAYGLGVNTFHRGNPREYVPTAEVSIENTGANIGWGCMIIIKREHWVRIPEQLKIWYGDHIIALHFQFNKNRPGYVFENVACTPLSASSNRPEFNEITRKDTEEFSKLPIPLPLNYDYGD